MTKSTTMTADQAALLRGVIANPDDDRTKSPFAPDLRRHTDQFLFKFRKPA